MDKVERAVACFREGFNCAQALLSTYGPQFDLSFEIALKISAPFGAGMGRMGEVCGAVTGAFLVIGLKYGNTRAEDRETKEKVYRLVREFSDIFQARNGSIVCRELLGCDISTPEGLEFAREKKLSITVCPKFVRDAAEIVSKILE